MHESPGTFVLATVGAIRNDQGQENYCVVSWSLQLESDRSLTAPECAGSLLTACSTALVCLLHRRLVLQTQFAFLPHYVSHCIQFLSDTLPYTVRCLTFRTADNCKLAVRHCYRQHSTVLVQLMPGETERAALCSCY